RRLAEQQPDVFLPDLATSLQNLGIVKRKLGRREDALRATQEAVDIRRRLAEQRPDAFLPDLAMSLGALGSVVIATQRNADAMDPLSEGLRIVLPVAPRLPQAHGELVFKLARALRQAARQANLPLPEDLAPLLEQLSTDE